MKPEISSLFTKIHESKPCGQVINFITFLNSLINLKIYLRIGLNSLKITSAKCGINNTIWGLIKIMNFNMMILLVKEYLLL